MSKILEINDLSVKLGGQFILNDINLVVEHGEFVALIGPNGSGKSTLLKAINHEYRGAKGRINFGSNKIAYLNQQVDTNLFLDFDIIEHYKIYSKFSDSNFSDFLEILRECNSDLFKYKNKKVKFLSGGQKQALTLALQLMSNPDLLLLDEHTSALDPKTASDIMRISADAVRRHKMSCIMVTHNLQHATNYADRVIVMKEGRIINPNLRE